jgi:CRP-like cAMP-binding protein
MSLEGLFRNAEQQGTLLAGQTLFEENDPGEHMFGVIEGAIELRKGDQVVSVVEPGGVFGEMALVDRSPRSLAAVARVDTRLAWIDKQTFVFLVHETPTFALDVMSILASRLRALNDSRDTTDSPLQ